MFPLDSEATMAATMLTDRHVKKMPYKILTMAQRARRVQYSKLTQWEKWLIQSPTNFTWLRTYYSFVMFEHRARFGVDHELLATALAKLPYGAPPEAYFGSPTTFPQVMPRRYWRGVTEYVEAYRDYYVFEKVDDDSYRAKPERGKWVDEWAPPHPKPLPGVKVPFHVEIDPTTGVHTYVATWSPRID